MKLYTELQVIALTKAAFAAGQNHNTFIFEEELKNLTPIELPSDEEIYRELKHHSENWEIRQALEQGAKWLKNKIQGGNK